MAMKINFDLSHNPELPVFVLATRSGKKLGQIDAYGVVVSDALKEAPEFSFKVNKYINGVKNKLWDKIVDFKLVWCKNYDMWYQITVDLDEATETIKTVSGVKLSKAELSQIMLYNIEINTENDIARDDYISPTVLYNEDPKISLLNRITEKAPHYKIAHVDSTIANIQRTFSFDDISIDDAFSKIEEEIGCIFICTSNSDEDGKINRTISVYDIQNVCNDCGYRGDFTTKCPKCGSEDIGGGYGEDTTIFITSDELANDIQFTTDTGSVKNCFKLEAGDDLMTATIRNCNPNGSDYIWYISENLKSDMSDELVEKINSYDTLYEYYQNEYSCNIPSPIINMYNNLVEKYRFYNESIESVNMPIVGYPSIMTAYYNTIDFDLYLESELMPDADLDDTNAIEQAQRLNINNIGTCAVQNTSSLSLSTANSVATSVARVIVDSRYRVKVNTSSLTNLIWTGNFTVTNYSDEEDTTVSETISINFTDEYALFLKQKIEKALSDSNVDSTDNTTITGLFKMDLDKFKTEIQKYCLNRLVSFHDACQACIDILIEQGISNNETWSGENPNLYNDLYIPYLDKLNALEYEIKIREEEISIVKGKIDEYGTVEIYGLQTYIDEEIKSIQDKLDFEKYIGEDLWHEFISYRREDKYTNDNYISDGLNNAEIFQNAQEFITVAKNEIYKSAELQHSISSTLKNLLVIKKFEPLVDYFEVGNWIRVMVDDVVYKLRLISYEIDFDDLSNISVEFSDVTKTAFGMTDQRDLIKKASSMASSYSSTKRQATKGSSAKETLNGWVKDGLDTTNTKIIGGADNQTQTWDSHGMLFRRYNGINETYDDTQLKIINSTIAITDDNWKSTKTAIGQFYYRNPRTKELNMAYGINGELIVGKMILGEGLGIYNDSGSLTFDENGFSVSNDINTVTINPNNNSIFNIKNKDNKYVLSFDDDGNIVIVGDITARSLTLLDDVDISAKKISGLSSVAFSGKYSDLEDAPDVPTLDDLTGGKTIIYTEDVNVGKASSSNGVTKQTITVGDKSFDLINSGDFVLLGQSYGTDTTDASQSYTAISKAGLLTAKNALIYGTIYATNGEFSGKIISTEGSIGGFKITDSQIYNDNGTASAGIGKYGSSWAFWAGATNINTGNAPFRVSHSGEAYASKMTVDTDLFFGHNMKYPMIYLTNDQEMGQVYYILNIGNPAWTYDDGQHNVQFYGIQFKSTAYTSDSMVVTSDKNLKNSITYLNNDKASEFIYSLKPCEFKYNHGTSDRLHHGFIAQDVKESMGDDDWGLYIEKPNKEKGLRYEELIADIIATVQSQNEKIKKLEKQIQE